VKSKQELCNEAAHSFYSDNKADNAQNLIEFEQLTNGLRGSTVFFSRILHILQEPLFRLSLSKDLVAPVFRKGWWHKSLKSLASEYLAFQFGYLPLLSDIRSTARGLRTLKRDLKRLASHQEVVTSTAKSHGVVDTSYALDGEGGSAAAPSTLDSTWWHPMIQSEGVRIVGVRGRKTRLYTSDSFQAVDFILKTLISPGPASLAWELAPFSFVLDWFIDLTPVLDKFDQILVGNDKVIDYVWESEKISTETSYVKHDSSTGLSKDGSLYVDPNNGGEIAKCSTSYYRRTLTNLSPTVELSHRFGKKQGLLAGALLTQTCANLKSLLR
jgi:hypothetical protein